MKNIVLISLLFMFSFAYAVDFVIPEVQNKFDSLDSSISALEAVDTTNSALLDVTTDGLNLKRVARATWDKAVDGGNVGAYDLGVTIPANALINFVYFYVVTQVEDGTTGTGALSCEDANNLYTATDVTGNAAGTVVLGIPQNSAGTMVKDIASACNLTWTIAGDNASAGAINFFVEYQITD